MQVLYIDVLFLLNFMVDCLLIGLTAMLRGYFLPIGRRLWGSVVGALLAVLAFFLPDALPSSLWAAVSCALMLLAAWGWKGKRRFAADCAMLWVLSMVFSGGTMLMAQWYGGMARGNAIYLDISVPILLGGTGTAYGLLTLCCRPGSVQAERRIHKIRCRLNGREICFSAFADTGNLLRDPVSGENVLIVPRKGARGCADELRRAYESTESISDEVATKSVFYPSDQACFPCGVGVAALKKTKRGNILYMNRIHTNRDVIYREENIEFLVSGSVKLTKIMSEK